MLLIKLIVIYIIMMIFIKLIYIIMNNDNNTTFTFPVVDNTFEQSLVSIIMRLPQVFKSNLNP